MLLRPYGSKRCTPVRTNSVESDNRSMRCWDMDFFEEADISQAILDAGIFGTSIIVGGNRTYGMHSS
jgi:hypothetical protein